MKNRVGAVLAGWAVGWGCYVLILLGFLLFGMPQHRMVYAVMPVVPKPSLEAQLSVLWLSHRTELVAVLLGFGLSFLVAIVVTVKASRHEQTCLQRPVVPLVLAFVGMVALVGVLELILFLLPLRLT